MYILIKQEWTKQYSKLINYLMIFKNVSAGKIKKSVSSLVSMNETLVKAMGIYPYSPNNGGRAEYSAPFSHSGTKADRDLTFLITWLPRLL